MEKSGFVGLRVCMFVKKVLFNFLVDMLWFLVFLVILFNEVIKIIFYLFNKILRKGWEYSMFVVVILINNILIEMLNFYILMRSYVM